MLYFENIIIKKVIDGVRYGHGETLNSNTYYYEKEPRPDAKNRNMTRYSKV